ncbi:ATP-binding protein [Tundrisphaera sp. TA3]|uniref:ATP-binding protein n=1 Tax=Tundrisphaera sp. TA3 TaxID=3435775 RepID=UPI003EB9C943
MTRATRLKLVIGFLLATSLLGAMSALAQLSTARLAADGRLVAQTLGALASLEETLSLTLDAETNQRGYLLAGDRAFLDDFETSAALAIDRAAVLARMVADNPEQARRARLLAAAIGERIALMRRAIATAGEADGQARGRVISGEGRDRMARCRALVAEMRAAERQLLADRIVVSERSTQFVAAAHAGLVIVVLGLLGVVYLLIRREFAGRVRIEEALRVSRERYAVAVRGSRDGLWDWDIVTNQSYFSPRWKQMLGYEDGELSDDYAQFLDLLHPDDLGRAQETIRCYLEGQCDEYEQEIRLRHRDGTYRWILTRGVALRDGDGRPYRMAGSHTDINARKVAEGLLSEQNRRLEAAVASEREAHDELKLAQSRLVQSEKLAGLGQMVAGVAHEINNPLAFVINNVAVLDRDIADLNALVALHEEATPLLAREAPDLLARIREFRDRVDIDYTLENLPGLLARSRDGLSRIEQVVKDLRLFARLDEGDIKEADLNDGIRTTITIIRGNARRDDVALEVDLRPLPPVACHPAKINQVVMNLLSNAVDASPAGGTVSIRSWPEADAVAIAVSDTGPGIDPAIRGRIFDPFFTTKPIGKGTGLGLSISYGIIQEHGGTIEVATAPGRGTTFTIHLPLAPSVPAHRDEPFEPASTA